MYREILLHRFLVDKILDIDNDLFSFYKKLRRAGWKSIIPPTSRRVLRLKPVMRRASASVPVSLSRT